MELPPLPYEQYSALKDNIALRGVLVPILVHDEGRVRRIIDGNHRKRIADELGYECPEIVATGLAEEELRLQARCLNLARRQLTQEQRRQIVSDQLRETPGRSNRWVGKQLGVHHATVAAVRSDLESTGQIIQCATRLGADNRTQPAQKPSGPAGINSEVGDPDGSLDIPPEVSLDGIGEEVILRAAAEIRQRRVAEKVQESQERRRTIRPATPRVGSIPVLHGDCTMLIPTLEDGSVALVVTSPPYADQRAGQYRGIAEERYPEYTVGWMESLRPKLREDGSILLVIRPHLRDGVLSDYVLRTRLALREAGWKECEELIWHKPDAPPLGSTKRPRRTWESVLWYSRSTQPFCDLLACGRESDDLGFRGSLRFGVGGDRPIHDRQNLGRESGVARITDVIQAPVGPGSREPTVDHPAMFPLALAEQLIRTYSQEGDLILDPFCGSGQTLLAARNHGRKFLGMECEEKYVRIAMDRLRT